MNTYWISFTLIWTIFYQKEATYAASLRSEPQDVGGTALQHGSHQLSEHQNYNMKPDENLNSRSMSPYDRRHRQIYTSKTYFGRNQMLDHPRTHWNSKKDGENTHLRTNFQRMRHPVKQSRLGPHDYILYENPQRIPHINMEIPPSEYNARPDENIVQVHNYDTNRDAYERAHYGRTPEHTNIRYEHPSPQYNAPDVYGYNPQQNANYNMDQASRYVSNKGHVQFPEYNIRSNAGYEQNAEHIQEYKYPQDPRNEANIARGNNEYDSHANIAQEYDGYSNFKPGQSVQPNNHPRTALNQGFISEAEKSQDYKYVSPGFEVNQRYVNHEHEMRLGHNAVRVDHYGRPLSVKNGQNSKHNFRSKILPHTEEKKAETIIEEKRENKEIEDNQKYVTTGYAEAINNNQMIEMGDKSKEKSASSEITSTASDSEAISDETLAKEEIFRILSDKNLFNQPSTSISTDLGDTRDTFAENLEGSGNVENSNEFSPTSDLESTKSARILEIFSRNVTVECMTPKNESGHCAGLTECPLLETMENFSSFLQYMCLQKSRLVGICCPDNPVVEVTDSQENATEKVKVDIEQPPDGCGISTHTRIVGGTMSVPHEFSWMVALLRRGKFYCGGVIINNWYILTAAHCVLGIKIGDLKVRLGEFDFHQRTDHQMDIPVSEIKRHALFVTLTFQHDIALLKLKRRIEYSKFIGSICLPNKEEGDFTATNATVVGWGTVSFGGSASPILRQVTVPVWDNKQCDETYVFERITDAFMCAGSPKDGEDACQGDSGGPLMSLSSGGRWSVIGIVSWGRRCGDPTYPGVYTRVTSYLDWIAENAQ